MTRYTTPAFIPATRLVAEREIRMKLRSKSFFVSTGILMLLVLGSVIFGGITGANPSLSKVAAVGTAVQVAEDTGAFDVTEVGTADEARALVEDETVDAAIVPDDAADSPTGFTVIGLDAAPGDVISALSITPGVEVLDPASTDAFLAYIVSIGFGLVFFMAAITFGQTIAQSVVEEKQTRVVEILMSTIPVRVLLAGKIVGNSLLAFGQILAIALVAGVGLLATGQDILLADVGPSIIWFIVFFAAGFVMLSALFSATASLVSRQEDLASAISPVTTLVMAPYILIILFNTNDLIVGIMSYVPFSAPVGMPMRVFLGTAEWWEPWLSLLILLGFTVVIVALGSRVYANGLLRMGAKVKLRDALSAR
jgi:ABC-2 type transport system permease protein